MQPIGYGERHVEDMMDNLLTHIQIVTLLSSCDYGGSSTMTSDVRNEELVFMRKMGRKPC